MDSFVNANLILLNVLGKKVNHVEDTGKNEVLKKRNSRNNGGKAKKCFKFPEKSMLCLPKYRTKMSEVKVVRSMSRYDMSGFWSKASMMDTIITEEEVTQAASEISKKALFKYGINPEPEKMIFDCNICDPLSIFVEKRLIENCTDYDILNNCSGVFLKWYYLMCLNVVDDFRNLRVENDDQRRVVILTQMSQLALCIAADYVNMKYESLVGIYFSIEVLLLVALSTRLYESKSLDMALMMDAVACINFTFIEDLFNVRHIVDKCPTWLDYVTNEDEDGNVISCEYKMVSPRLDDDYTLFVNPRFKPVLKLKDWMVFNSLINRAILDSEMTDVEAHIINLLNAIDVQNLRFKPETLRRVKSVCRRLRLREFKMLELLLDDMYNTYDSQTVTSE